MGGLFGGGSKTVMPPTRNKKKEKEELKRKQEKLERRFAYGADMLLDEDNILMAQGDTTLSNASLLNIQNTLGG